MRNNKIRVRMAPSPTGSLHIGTARTALFNWLFAKKHNGEFIVRIEDTDKERSKKEYEEDILRGFEWLGLNWDELYHQSERTKYYAKHIQKLLDGGDAFWCYHSKAELEEEQNAQVKKKEPPRHVCEHKNHELKIVNQGGGIVRLKVSENSNRKIVFEDIIKGKIEFEENLLGDFSIAKSMDEPLYNFAVVVDDHMMEISHIIRGEDHIANTPKQILIYKALNWAPPKFAHLPLILGEDRSKMSKRDDIVRVSDYREKGYLPDALINFLSLLGWTPKGNREILTANEVIEQFKLENIHKSGAIFDIKKLNWINSQYIKMENDVGLVKLIKPFVKKHFGNQGEQTLLKIMPLFRQRLEYLDQVGEYHYFFAQPKYEPDLLIWKKSDKNMIQKSLSLVKSGLENGEKFDENGVRHILDEIAKNYFDNDRGAVYWPLRVSLSGKKYSSDPLEILSVIGINEGIIRINIAISKLDEL